MSVINFNAAKKWNQLPKPVQQQLLDNVFCSSCGVTTIVDYTLHDDEFGLLLKGKCKTCNGNVARLIEDE
ncbi:hypothetical protein ACJ2A9_00595 [Anaerobacillus sp. MEB173]|uniref:hypothetical protein n=1 Tax=Anaerobacillus sp. MEB173 TaxID=3383345 RepID=UPI003F8F0538